MLENWAAFDDLGQKCSRQSTVNVFLMSLQVLLSFY